MKRLRVRESITVQNAEAMVITDGLIATLHDDPAGRGVLVRYADREVLVPWANVRSFERTLELPVDKLTDPGPIDIVDMRAGDYHELRDKTRAHKPHADETAPFTVKRGKR